MTALVLVAGKFMASQSKPAGNQMRWLLREAKTATKRLQEQTDRAVRFAEQKSEVGAIHESPLSDAVDSRLLASSAGGSRPAPTGGISGAVPELPDSDQGGEEKISVADMQAKIAQGYTYVFGASGNPLTGGFLVDLGEYNRDVMGLNGVRVYEKMVRSDGQVRGLLSAMETPIRMAQWQILPPAPEDLLPGQTQAKAKEVVAFVKSNLLGGLESRTVRGGWVSQSWQNVISNCLGMLSFGCKVGELVYRVDGAQLRLREIADLEPLTYYRWHTDPAVVDATLPVGVYDDGRTLQALQQYGYRGSQFITPTLPADKIVRITYGQRGANFWGIPPTRVMYPDWFMKSALKRIDAIACERNSLGVPTIELPPGASQQDRTFAQNFVTQLASHEKTGLTLPPGAKFVIVGISGRLRDILPSMEYADMQMARSVLAMFMQQGGAAGKGNRSLGESQTDFFILSEQSTADHIGETLRNSVVRPLVAMNFGEDAPTPLIRATNVEARSIEMLSQIVSQLSQQAAFISDRGSINQNRRALGYPDFVDEDVALARGVTMPGLNMPDDGTQPDPEQQDSGKGQVVSGKQKQNAKTQASEVVIPNGSEGSGSEARFLAAARNDVRVNPRSTPSPFWQPGDPEHLKNIHPREAHVDFPAHDAIVRNAQSDIRNQLSAVSHQRIRRYADTMAKALKKGVQPSAVSFQHDQELQDKILAILAPLYQAARGEVRKESGRLGETRREAWRSNVAMAEVPQGKYPGPPGLIAEVTVQDIDADLANATRKAAIDLKRVGAAHEPPLQDMDAGDIADELFGAIGDVAYVDNGLDQAASGAARTAFREGRDDEFQQIVDELKKQGVEVKLIRVSAREKESCQSCLDADGEEVDAGEDITAIHEGPPETCECEVMESV
jgi:hypothetical protein